jgi:hypothetical protein
VVRDRVEKLGFVTPLREQQEQGCSSEQASVSARQRPRGRREVTKGKHAEGDRHCALRDADSPTAGA